MSLHLAIQDAESMFQKINLQSLLCGFLITFIVFCVRRLYFSPLSNLPGPFITALTPNYLTLLTHFNHRTVTLHEWHQRYGPVIRISPIEVSVISSEGVKEVYSDPAYGKYTQLYGIFKHFGEQNSFSSGPKEEHGWRRKAVSDRYTMTYVLKEERRSGKIFRIVQKYLKFVQESLPEVADRHLKHTNEYYSVDLYTANTFFATDVVTSHLFGPRFSTNSLAGDEGDREMVNGHYRSARKSTVHLKTGFPKFMAFVEKLILLSGFWSRIIGTCLFLEPEPTKKYIGGSRIDDYGWHAYQKAKVSAECDGYVAEKLATIVKNRHNTGETWSDKQAASELMDHMLAGMDTTSDTLTFLMYHLSLKTSTQIQKKLQDELSATFTSSPATGFIFKNNALGTDYQRIPADLLSKVLMLPYLDAVLKETLRLYAAIPVTLPRVVPFSPNSPSAAQIKGGYPTYRKRNGRYIGEYFLPAGTVVGSFAYGIHRDKSVFTVPDFPGRALVPGVDDFYPERWLVGEGKNTSELSVNRLEEEQERIKMMERRFWAFGSGGRGCVGKHLAIFEMKLLLAVIYSGYNTEVDVSGGKISLGHDQWNERKTFRDVLPFCGVKGVIKFVPRVEQTQNPR